MRIVFCDDDKQQLGQLYEYVSEYFEARSEMMPEHILYSTGDELIRKERIADIAFLDIEMPGVNGIRVAAYLKEKNPNVLIFVVTSHLEYLDDAMRLQTFRYILKPINKKRLFSNLDDAMYQYNTFSKEIAICTAEGISVVSTQKIVCVEGAGHYTNVYTTDEGYRSRDSFGYWTELLKLPCFFKTHRSYIINMKYVSKFNAKEILLRYSDKVVRAKISRLNYSKFVDTYFAYLERTK